MFTKPEQRFCIKIEVERCRSTQVCFQRLREAWRCSVTISQSGTMGKAFREGRDAVQDNLHTGRPQVENNIVKLLPSLLDDHYRWPSRNLTAEVGVCHKTVLHILHDILICRKFIARWIPHIISEMQQWHRRVGSDGSMSASGSTGPGFKPRRGSKF